MNKKKLVLWSGLGLFSLLIILFLQFNIFYELGLQSYYANNFYQHISLTSNDDKSKKYLLVNPYAQRVWGWKTKNNLVLHPTQVAGDGLNLILRHDVEFATRHANWLLKHSTVVNSALFFPFQFDFGTYYPYYLKAPWNSGITQGLSLGLFSYLYKETKNEKYLDAANKIYNSFSIPIEKGGFTRYDKEGLFFEEYPTKEPSRVLNGAIVAMLALHDYAIITRNKEAETLFIKSVNRFAFLLPEYNIKDSSTGVYLSSYSLAKTRPEVLGRFVGDGNALLHEIKLIGVKNSKEVVLSSLQVGLSQDDDVTKNFYISTDYTQMNWGDASKIGKYNCREINAIKGQYNHSPFKFLLSPQYNYEMYQIVVTYKSINGRLSLQLFDEKEFWKLGNIIHSSKDTPIFKTSKFTVPSSFITSWNNKLVTKPKVEKKYLDDNQELVKIVGNLTKNKIFLNYAQKWKDSITYVPSLYFNKFPNLILKASSIQKILPIIPGGSESLNVKFPSVIKINDKYFLYYSTDGEDKQWHINLATSSDNINWTRQGWIFDSNSMPASRQASLSFPFVIKNKEVHSSYPYIMYFSCAKSGNSYNNISWAYSRDGYKWKYGGVAVEEQGLDPFVLLQKNGQYAMFYTQNNSTTQNIVKTISDDGITWSIPVQVIKGNHLSNFYTMTGLNINDKFCLLLEETIRPSQRHEIKLACDKGDNKFIYNQNNPIVLDQDWVSRWDAIRYGYNLFQDGNKLFVYYNGTPKLGADRGSQIGRAELDIKLLSNYVSNLFNDNKRQ